MRILLIGDSAVDHAIAKSLKKSKKCEELIVYAGSINNGIKTIADIYHVGDLNDMKMLQGFAMKNNPDFAIISSSKILAHGIVDILQLIGIPCVGPSKNMAKLESSKSFMLDLFKKYKIPYIAKYKTFRSGDGIMRFASSLNKIVIKPDGITDKSEVAVQGIHFETLESGVLYAQDCLEKNSKIIVQEKLIGEEFTLMSFIDGKKIIDMPASQNCKRAFNKNQGPNTNGMGAYVNENILAFLTEKDLKIAHKLNLYAINIIQKEYKNLYKGIICGNFIKTKDGIRLLEYNVRFGDPDAINALELLESDFVDICDAIIHGKLNEINVQFSKKASISKYIVVKNYPENKSKEIKISKDINPDSIFYANDNENDNKICVLLENKGNLELAYNKIEKNMKKIKGEIFHREDIGSKESIKEKVDFIKSFKK